MGNHAVWGPFPDGLELWKNRTHESVRKAIVDVAQGNGTPEQSKLVDAWVADCIHNASSEMVCALFADLRSTPRSVLRPDNLHAVMAQSKGMHV